MRTISFCAFNLYLTLAQIGQYWDIYGPNADLSQHILGTILSDFLQTYYLIFYKTNPQK